MDKRMREMKREIEALGVTNVYFEPRKGTHFLIHGMKDGKHVQSICPLSNWSVLIIIKRNFQNGRPVRG